MPVAALANRTLVLDRNLRPVNLVSAQAALGKVFAGQALILSGDLQFHDFDSWVRNWSDASLLSRIESRLLVHSQAFAVPVPEVIVVEAPASCSRQPPRLSRRNLFLRDRFTCQYCGRRLPSAELNLDHVMPRSRGGRSTWDNLVLSCIPCNTRKADRTPAEAGMPLLSQPRPPEWAELDAAGGTLIWRSLVAASYWHGEIE